VVNIYTGGTFDLFHEGHLELLEACKRLSGAFGKVIVAVNTDEFIERFKGRKPVQSTAERIKMLKACKYVDYVIENFGEEDSTKTIDSVKDIKVEMGLNGGFVNEDLWPVLGPVDVVAIGTDWAGRDYYGQMGFTKQWLDERNIILVYIDRRTGQSTTNLKQILKDY
jgi:glycerol-3-phosphate cytidylyltransferase